MTTKEIKAAHAALASASYTLTPDGKGRQAVLARFLAAGRWGQRLVVAGWSEDAFALCIAEWMHFLAAQGATAPEMHDMLRQIGACNSSAASKAAAGIVFACDGIDPKGRETSLTLGDVWTHCLGSGARPLAADLSRFGL
jgi:hypothetical protein